MIKKVNRRNFRIYAFDFETHNDSESIAMNKSGVWLGSIIDENDVSTDENIYFYSIKGFMHRLRELTSLKRSNSKQTRPTNNLILYAYNLSFEWSFILPELLREGFEWQKNIDKKDLNKKLYSSVTTHSCSSVWSVTISLGNGSLVILKDLAKIYGGGLGKVANSMGLTVTKGSIDYTKNRLHNHKVTREEKEYNFIDNRIVVEVLLKNENDSTFWKSFSASTYACRELIDFGYPTVKKKMGAFRKDYPKPDKLEYDFLRKTVAGGITYAPERWQFKEAKNVKHIDAHQMHPTQAYLHLFPYGKGEYGTGKPKHLITRISACHIRVTYTGVKLHSVIKLIGIDAIENASLWVWSFEIPTMKKCYENLQIEYVDYYEYHSKFLPWREFYKHNYDERVKARARGDKYNVDRFKLLNNSSYGKLLEKEHEYTFENTIDEESIITSISHENENEELGAKYTALQVGSCIPAYSRVQLIETALKFGYKNVVYFDTDSIFYIDNEESRNGLKYIELGDALGTWAFEEDIERMQVTAPKRYKLELVEKDKYNKNKIVVKMAGVNGIDTSVPFEEINIIDSEWEVRRAYRCIDGTLLKMQKKSLSVQKKYKDTYKKNVENTESRQNTLSI